MNGPTWSFTLSKSASVYNSGGGDTVRSTTCGCVIEIVTASSGRISLCALHSWRDLEGGEAASGPELGDNSVRVGDTRRHLVKSEAL